MTAAACALSEEQLLVLDLLMRARQKGVIRVSRTEILANDAIPVSARIKLTWAALTMPDPLIVWHGQHEFGITDAGAAAYRLAVGEHAEPTAIGDRVICLPDLSNEPRVS